jgi:Raf kinase inhibitor-like YbhB/YbcL family protein
MLENLPDAVGHALSDVRAGLDKTLYLNARLREGMGAIRVASPAFADHSPIPTMYTADGEGLSPPLIWSGVPQGTREIVLIVEDADAPTPQPIVHAIVTALPGEDGELAEGTMGHGPDHPEHPPGVPMGRNSLLRTVWLPPDPPPGHGIHRYLFQVFALGDGEPVEAAAGRESLRRTTMQRAIASGCLVGTYERIGPRDAVGAIEMARTPVAVA